MVISLSPAPNPFLLYRKLFEPHLLSLSRLLKKKSWTGQLCFDYTSGMVCLGLSENHPFKGPDSFPSATVKGEACPQAGGWASHGSGPRVTDVVPSLSCLFVFQLFPCKQDFNALLDAL